MRGSITKRGNNSWRVRYDLPEQPGVERRQATLTVRGLKKDAEAKLAEIMASMGNAEFVEPSKQSLGAYLDHWIDAKQGAVSTLSNYRMMIKNHLKPGLGRIPVQQLTYQQVERYYKVKRGEGLSEQTLKHHHALLRTALRDAARRKVVPRCVVDDVQAPSPVKPDIVAIGAELNTKLLDLFIGQYRIMVLLSIATGMRRGEVCGLKWDCVSANSIHVRRSLYQVGGGEFDLKPPKTKKSTRKVTLPQSLVLALRSQRARQAGDKLAAGELYHDQSFVFANALGEPSTPWAYTKHFGTKVKGTEFEGVTVQSLRHSHASQLIAGGVNIKTISERLGHSTITITLDTYGHLLPGMDEAAAEVMEENLEKFRDHS